MPAASPTSTGPTGCARAPSRARWTTPSRATASTTATRCWCSSTRPATSRSCSSGRPRTPPSRTCGTGPRSRPRAAPCRPSRRGPTPSAPSPTSPVLVGWRAAQHLPPAARPARPGHRRGRRRPPRRRRAGRGIAMACLQVDALLGLLDDGADPLTVAEPFGAWCDEHIRPWVEDHVAIDGESVARWQGADLDLERPLTSARICDAAQVDPRIGRYAGPFSAMVAPPASLAPAEPLARAVYETGWRPSYSPGPEPGRAGRGDPPGRCLTRSGLRSADSRSPAREAVRGCRHGQQEAGSGARTAARDQLPRVGASGGQGCAGGAAQAQGLRLAAQDVQRAHQRAPDAPDLPGLRRAGGRAPVRPAAPAAGRRGLGPRRRRAAGDVRGRRPDAQRPHHRDGPADHRHQLGRRRPLRRGRAALPDRPRARSRAQRSRGLSHPARPAARAHRGADVGARRRRSVCGSSWPR